MAKLKYTGTRGDWDALEQRQRRRRKMLWRVGVVGLFASAILGWFSWSSYDNHRIRKKQVQTVLRKFNNIKTAVESAATRGEGFVYVQLPGPPLVPTYVSHHPVPIMRYVDESLTELIVSMNERNLSLKILNERGDLPSAEAQINELRRKAAILARAGKPLER